MRDRDLFDILQGEIDKTRGLFIQNEKNLQGQEKILKDYLDSADEAYHLDDEVETKCPLCSVDDSIKLLTRNAAKLSGKLEALEDFRTTLVCHGYFTEE